MIQEYLSKIFNINMMLQDSIDEFMKLNQETFDDLTNQELFDLYKELLRLEKDVVSRFTYPLQDMCITVGEKIIIKNK